MAGSRAWWILGLTAALGVGVLFALDRSWRFEAARERELDLRRELQLLESSLEQELSRRLLAVESLRAFLQAGDPLPDGRAFDRYARELLARSPETRVLQYVDRRHVIRFLCRWRGTSRPSGWT